MTVDMAFPEDPAEAMLQQQRLIPEDVGLVANETILRAERVTGQLLHLLRALQWLSETIACPNVTMRFCLPSCAWLKSCLPCDSCGPGAAARARARAREGGYHSDGADYSRHSPSYVPTRPKTFGFEKRAQARPKPIAQVKMEQDLEMRRREEEIESSKKFKANKVCMGQPRLVNVHAQSMTNIARWCPRVHRPHAFCR
jgi:hypothetical protein